MSIIKLKPCPFCGSKMVLSNLYSWEVNADHYANFVYCQECNASGPVITGNEVEPDECRWDKAREAWNKRAQCITDTMSVKMESAKMINESSLDVLAECLRILPVRESDSFDMVYQGDVEDVLGLESDGDCLYTAESVYRLADLITSCGDRVGEADD